VRFRLWPGRPVLLLVLAVAACGAPGEPGPAVRRQAITGGALEPGLPAVGAIVPVSPLCGEPDEAQPVACTGTLIAPNAVLTAAHCIENADYPRSLSVVFAADAAGAPPAGRVRTLDGRIHPAWLPGEHDLGVLILAGAAPVAPVPLAEEAFPEDGVGRTVQVVGFGLDEQGHTGHRRSGTAQVSAVGAGAFSIQAAPGMSCGGDSGGPVFLEAGGTGPLVGVTSFGNLACTAGTNMRIDAHEAFLREALAAAAQTPPARAPFGPEVDACTVRCQEHADCPLGMACVPWATGEKSCAAAGLEAGRFGPACTHSDDNRLCVKAGEGCRVWLPCEATPAGGGCSASGGSGALEGLLLALLARAAGRRLPGRPGRGAQSWPLGTTEKRRSCV
jgi:V8-like Glu-specific endopeptidase